MIAIEAAVIRCVDRSITASTSLAGQVGRRRRRILGQEGRRLDPELLVDVDERLHHPVVLGERRRMVATRRGQLAGQHVGADHRQARSLPGHR